MHSKVLVFLVLAGVALANDILEGTNDTDARNLHDVHYEASPAIWKQTKELFINASEHEVISKINITDLRPAKDGDAQITAGGVGQNNVTITLKSPTILRGYDFLVSVYCTFDQNGSVQENNSNSQPPESVRGENPEIPEEKVHTEIPSDVATGKTELFTESGPTTVTGKPVQIPDKSSEVTGSTATLSGDVTSKPKTKESSEPDVTEALESGPEEVLIHVHEREPKVEPFNLGFHPPKY